MSVRTFATADIFEKFSQERWLPWRMSWAPIVLVSTVKRPWWNLILCNMARMCMCLSTSCKVRSINFKSKKRYDFFKIEYFSFYEFLIIVLTLSDTPQKGPLQAKMSIFDKPYNLRPGSKNQNIWIKVSFGFYQ